MLPVTKILLGTNFADHKFSSGLDFLGRGTQRTPLSEQAAYRTHRVLGGLSLRG